MQSKVPLITAGNSFLNVTKIMKFPNRLVDGTFSLSFMNREALYANFLDGIILAKA